MIDGPRDGGVHGYPWKDIGVTTRRETYPNSRPLDRRDRVEEHLRQHPDASVPQVLGRFCYHPVFGAEIEMIMDELEEKE